MTFALSVHNYKRLHDTTINIHPLTVFCGQNNVGKSSVIQALTLLKASVSEAPSIPLNGLHGMNLGALADIVSATASDDRITLTTSYNGGERYECTIIADSNNGEQRYFIPKREGNPRPPLSTAAPFGFTYLCAERDGPRDSQELQSNSKEAMQVGAKGEYAADVVSGLEYEDIRDLMLHTSQAQSAVKNRQLRHNLELWMQDFFPDILIEARRVENINRALFRFRKQSDNSDWTKPVHCGFGISYVLPIILAGLLAPENGLIIVENPEAHLHPSAQSLIGRFLATVASTGVYVILETHSDHILNGIRLACVDEHPISRKDVCIYNFALAAESDLKIEDIYVTDTGNLTTWPKQFFDQTEKDLLKILKARQAKK